MSHRTTALLYILGRATAAIQLEIGEDVPVGVASTIRDRLKPYDRGDDLMLLDLGRTAACVPKIVSAAALASVGAEGYIVKRVGMRICAVGNPSAYDTNASSSIGSAYAAYDIMERLGFGFLHPLSAVAPITLNMSAIPDGTNESHSPTYRFRGFHVHTEHPLELIEVLQGSAASLPNGTVVPWASMVPDVHALFEWLIANRQNHVQWILLTTPEWRTSGWVNSTQRQLRIRHLTDLGRSFGLRVGADIPIAEVQQRAWYMVEHFTAHDVPGMAEQIHTRLDWVLGGGGGGGSSSGDGGGGGGLDSSHRSIGAAFDYLASESGTSEFTHPACKTMLALISATSDYAYQAYGKRSYIKCHASTGQTCPDLSDPRSGDPINFNFLPMLASKTMGVLPHPIQDYSLEDPTDGAYGNDNFAALREFMEWEAANDTSAREVVFHPETNYWVNVDIDVPLFLPIAGERRLHDLRSISIEEIAKGVPPHRRVSGQLIFDSGWEWGSWLSDVVAARSSWDPLLTPYPSPSTQARQVYAAALQPIANTLLGPGVSAATPSQLVAALSTLADQQHRLLTLGQASGLPPPSPSELHEASGWGLLSGRDAWTDLLQLVGVARTQPGRVGFHNHNHELYPRIAPLAAEINNTFGGVAAELRAIADGATASPTASLLHELADASTLLAWRAEFVATLYAATAPRVSASDRKAAFARARAILSRAAALVAARESQYRVDAARIGGWRRNPTAYEYGYLWTVHSLYYWWRDLGQAERGSLEAALSPCYLNSQFPYDVVLGGGRNLSSWLREYVREKAPQLLHSLGDCLAPPTREYVFPRDLYAYGQTERE